jgi:type IV pilus assembly protein PilM
MGRLTAAMTRAATGHLVGVVFDDHYVRGVEVAVSLRRHRERPGATRAGTVRLPPGAIDHGVVADRVAVAAALRDLWHEAGFRSRRVALGLDARAAVIRRAELPVIAPDQMAQAAAYEIGELLSYPVDQAVVSSVELGRSSVSGVETASLLTLAVNEGTILELMEAAKQADLEPATTELVLTALVAGASPSSRSGVGAVVHVTSSTTDVAIYDDEGILFGRVISAGVDVSESSLSDQLAMELALLDGYTSGRRSGTATAVAAMAVPGIATVVEGVRRTLQYYTTEVDDRPLDRLVLCGPQSGAGGLADAFGECFAAADIVSAEAWAAPGDTEDESGHHAAHCVAIAASGGGGGLRRFDLVPAAVRARRAARLRLAVGVGAAALLCPLLAADAIARRAEIAEQEAQLDSAQVVVESLQSELATYVDDQVREAEAGRAADRVDELQAHDHGFPTLVRQVAESMPGDTFLTSLQVRRATTGEAPTGYNGPSPAAMLSLSGVAGDLDGVGRWMQEVDDVPAVDGLWLTQSAFGPYDSTDRVAAVFTVDGAVTGPAEPVRTLEGDG